MRLPITPQEAKSAPIWINVAKTLIQIVLMWGFFLALVPFLISRLETIFGIPRFHIPPWIGIGFFALNGGIGIYSGMLFAVKGSGTPLPLDTTTRLVILGPYRWVRNPMAITGILPGVAVGLTIGSWSTIVYSISGAFAWHLIARPWEEADLVNRFGESYLDYQQSIPLWLPTRTPYRPVVPEKAKSEEANIQSPNPTPNA